MKLALDTKDIFGQVSPPPGSEAFANPIEGAAKVIGKGINLFFIVAGFAMLIYLLWGGFDWITSGGDKEKVSKAQNKITNAVIGMFVCIIALAIFNIITIQILHIIGSDWEIILPTF